LWPSSVPRNCSVVSHSLLDQGLTTVEYSINQAIILTPTLAEVFDITDPGRLTWATAGFSLTVGSFILISGRLGDLFGYRKMMIIGFSWFSLWSMIAGLAVYTNYIFFVFTRVMQGIGSSILLPNALALFGAAYNPGFRKGLVFSFFGAAAPTGAVFGAVITSLFIKVWWPWSFWVLSMLLAGLAVATYFVVPDFLKKTNRPETLRETLVACDLLGAATGITALVLFNFAWNQAPISGWSSPGCIATLVLGVLLVPTFFYIELRISKYPLIPFEAITADVGLILACVALGWGCFGVWLWYTWQILLNLRGLSPLLATAWFCPVAISGPSAAILTGFLLRRLGPAPVMTLALCAFTTGMALVMTSPLEQTYWAQIFVAVVVMPFGMDMSFPAATLILSDAVKREHQGVAASLVNTVVNYSISLALGFAGTVEVHQNRGGETVADTLHGYRAAMWLGESLAAAGVLVSLAFMLKHWLASRTAAKTEKVSQSSEKI
jgi:MFS family permease